MTVLLARYKEQRQALQAAWLSGRGGDDELRRHSRAVDSFITESFAKIAEPATEGDVALVALGGYGREELFPWSDVDLMILYRPHLGSAIGGIADGVLYPLWDLGLEVGHGVRTIDESMTQAAQDYFFLVALLDARLIAGSSTLFAELLTTFIRNFVEGRREEFVETMKAHRRSRRERFGSHSYLLEPHVKEGRGGMRDIQAMLWTARVVFGLQGLSAIGEAGLLLPDELADFAEARSVLVRLRSYMHMLARRKTDQLYFEQQGEVASAFGHVGVDGILGVERFMREVYGALQKVSVISDLFFDHVDEVLGLAGRGGVVDAESRP